jgi:hypothetical protein
LYIDALRSVGVPARIAGTPAWNGVEQNGNHNWVEVYLGIDPYCQSDCGDGWYFNEAYPAGPGETFDNPCDKWFCNNSKFNPSDPLTTKVFAAKFSKEGDVSYPMAWDLRNKEIPGIERSQYYMNACSKC